MPRVNPPLATTLQPSVPSVNNETSSSRIGTIAITIIGMLASFVFLPFEAAIPMGVAIMLGALCFNGCLNPENIRNTFMPFRPPAVGPRPFHPRGDDNKGCEPPPIPIAVPAQPFTGYHANPHVHPPVTRNMQGERKAPDPRMGAVAQHSFRQGPVGRPLNRPQQTIEREEVHD